jgi:hypothetical protein
MRAHLPAASKPIQLRRRRRLLRHYSSEGCWAPWDAVCWALSGLLRACEVWLSRFFRPSASLLVIFVWFCAGSAVCGCGFAHEGRTPSTLLLPAQALSAAPTAIIAITLPMALIEATIGIQVPAAHYQEPASPSVHTCLLAALCLHAVRSANLSCCFLQRI